jgi:hypothetical protein
VTKLRAVREVPAWELGYRASADALLAAVCARERLAGRAAGLAASGSAVALVAPEPAAWVGVAGIGAAAVMMAVRMGQGDRRRVALDRLAELPEPPVDPAPALRPMVEGRRAALTSPAHRRALACTVESVARAPDMASRVGSPGARVLAREPELARRVAAALEAAPDVRLVVAVERLLATPDQRTVEPVRRLVTR